ncbi:serine protease DegS [Ectothiorhodosinus mongolicus]|uniref:Serine protease DegS n=1 Tax=Ectothiorhodosinus mongolicus TaxID=233100 RepID=A0A1R3VQ88_9GAMM|nr:Do family serine endopeptidase [Ectothiorhodosinus mongolicus]ULX56699.1 transcriptional regulator [Ectothiorhodosinus mongolicus]SIT66890.1 serine protease DegS [Ectothiorhodosinus mongolicus]
MTRISPFLLQMTAIGIAVAALILAISPDQSASPEAPPAVVEVRQSEPVALSAQQGPVSYAEAVNLAGPAVVNIHTRKTVVQQAHPFADDPFFRHFFGDRFGPPTQQREQTSLGSGVIISAAGYMLTNNHVIEGADEIQATLADGRSFPARIVGTDPETDLAVLRIDTGNEPLQSIVMGRSRDLLVGDVVLAVGNPFGVGQTVTLGIVSATGRSRLGISTYEDFIQTDAAINPGNSGGALINAHGELIGVNTAIFTRSGGSQGIGFAIPIDLARDIITQIIQSGTVVRGWLGIEVQEITPQLARSFGLEDTRGVIIAGLLANGPAARAGIRRGDVLTHMDGDRITDGQDALNFIARRKPGETLQMQGLRNGQAFRAEAEVGQRPRPQVQR